MIYFTSFDFIFKFFLQRKKIYTLKLIIALNFSLLFNDICFQSFFPSLKRISIQWMRVVWWTQMAGKWLFLAKLQSRGTNKLLTKWNLSQAFGICFTLCLYLWWSLYLRWRVSRLIYVFPKLSNVGEKLLGKIILTSCLWKCK